MQRGAQFVRGVCQELVLESVRASQGRLQALAALERPGISSCQRDAVQAHGREHAHAGDGIAYPRLIEPVDLQDCGKRDDGRAQQDQFRVRLVVAPCANDGDQGQREQPDDKVEQPADYLAAREAGVDDGHQEIDHDGQRGPAYVTEGQLARKERGDEPEVEHARCQRGEAIQGTGEPDGNVPARVLEQLCRKNGLHGPERHRKTEEQVGQFAATQQEKNDLGNPDQKQASAQGRGRHQLGRPRRGRRRGRS